MQKQVKKVHQSLFAQNAKLEINKKQTLSIEILAATLRQIIISGLERSGRTWIRDGLLLHCTLNSLPGQLKECDAVSDLDVIVKTSNSAIISFIPGNFVLIELNC